MNEIIAALQDEIAAADKRLCHFIDNAVDVRNPRAYSYCDGYYKGLLAALAILEKEPARELPYLKIPTNDEYCLGHYAPTNSTDEGNCWVCKKPRRVTP